MAFRKNTFLGLVLEEDSLVVAVVVFRGKTFEILRTAEWIYPEGVPVGEMQGRALQQFLREQRISTAPVIVGISAKKIITKEKSVPVSDAETLASLLRLESEKDFAVSPEELLLDYIGGQEDVRKEKSPQLLLIGARSKDIDLIFSMVRGAGLKIIGIIPYLLSMVYGEDVKRDYMGLYFGKGSVELVAYVDGLPRIFKQLCIFSSSEEIKELLASISRGVRNTLMLLSAKEPNIPSEILLWDDLGLDENLLKNLISSLPLPVKKSDGQKAFADIVHSPVHPPSYAAFSLARAGADVRNLPMNFIDSKMSIKKKSRWRKTIVMASVMFGLIALVLFIGIIDLHKKKVAVKKIKEDIQLFAPELEKAGAVIEYMDFMLGWQGEKMKFLEVLREVTLAFPLEGRIWMTSMAVKEDMRILLTGKASESKSVMRLMDNLKINSSFSEVNLVYLRDAGGDIQEVAYAISLIFAFKDEKVEDLSVGGH